MTSLNYDLIYLGAAIDSLEDFLLVGDLFWPIGVNPPAADPPYPSLSLGGLLLYLQRVKARKLPLDLEAKFTRLSSMLQKITNEWQTAWTNKASKAFQMRLNMWRDFIEEYRQDPDSNSDRYSYEIRLRVMLHLLQKEIVELNTAEKEMITGLDTFLNSFLVHRDFIWDEDMAGGFSRDVYWYLYGELPNKLF